MSCTRQRDKSEGDTWNICVVVTSESPDEMAGHISGTISQKG